jgi:hypothetical protein
MSDTPTTEFTSRFSRTKVEALPMLYCVGNITAFPAPVNKDDSLFYNSRFQITGRRGSKDMQANFLFRPEWFDPSFDVATSYGSPIKDEKTGKDLTPGLKFVYESNIAPRGKSKKLTTLNILGGSPSGYATLEAALFTASEAASGKLGADQIHEIINNHLADTGQPLIGYILRQKTDKNADGTKELVEGYEVYGYFYVDGEGTPAKGDLEYFTKQVKAGKSKWGYERA